MNLTAKCQNTSGCVRALHGTVVRLRPGDSLTCRECGRTLAIEGSDPKEGRKIVLAAAAALALAIGVAVLLYQRNHVDQGGGEKSAVVSENPNLSISEVENATIRQDVLARIDLLPSATEAEKQRFRQSLQHARKMGKILTIPFAVGSATVKEADIQAFAAALEEPKVKSVLEDPAAAFVILGYADSKGDPAKTKYISDKRAEAVVEAIRKRLTIANVMHPVGMGGTTLHDASNLEKNRIAEVWVVLP